MPAAIGGCWYAYGCCCCCCGEANRATCWPPGDAYDGEAGGGGGRDAVAPEAPGARCEGAATAPLPPNDDDGAGDLLAVRGAGVVVDDGVNVRGGGGLLPLDAGRCGEVPDLADATDADDEGCWRKTGDAAGASIDPMVLASAASLVRTSAAISSTIPSGMSFPGSDASCALLPL